MTPAPASFAQAALLPSALRHVVLALRITRRLWPDAHIDLVVHAAPQGHRRSPALSSPGLQWRPAHAPILLGPALRVRLVPGMLPQVNAWLEDPPLTLIPVLDALTARDPLGATEAMCAWLTSVISEDEPGAVSAAGALLLSTPGRVPMADLMDWTRTSERTLQRQCRHQLGCTLTGLQRLIRFERTLLALAAQPRPALALLAADLGFADQAHLSREMRRFTGHPPLVLWREIAVPETFKTVSPPLSSWIHDIHLQGGVFRNINLLATDVGRSLRFYKDVLGFALDEWRSALPTVVIL